MSRKNLPPSHRPGLLFCLRFFTLFLLAASFNAFCLLLDAVLFPGYRATRIRSPIFIIGNTRSGTTILHRVMAGDEEQFFCFRTWEIIFPSVLQKKIVSYIGRLDRLMGERLRCSILRSQAKRLREFNRIHQTGLFLPEEDDKLLVHILASTDLVWFFPHGEFDKMARLDVALDARDQRRIMEFYVRCVKRQAYFKGGQRALLSKNPWFTGKVANLLKYFPDCKIIYLVRNPLDVVASSISAARVIIRSTWGVEPQADMEELVYETIKFYYTYPLERLSSLPADRFMVVNYDDLIRQPKQAVRQIYDQLGLTLTSEYEKRLDQEVAEMKEYRSRHEYSLDQCSVARERILFDLRHVFEQFGFDTGAKSRQTVHTGPGDRDVSDRS